MGQITYTTECDFCGAIGTDTREIGLSSYIAMYIPENWIAYRDYGGTDKCACFKSDCRIKLIELAIADSPRNTGDLIRLDFFVSRPKVPWMPMPKLPEPAP